MGKFHITITDNETQETLIDTDTCAIIAGIDEGEESRSFAVVKCNALTVAFTIAAAQDAIDAQKAQQPILVPMLGAIKRAEAEASSTLD
jgi:hypothetical protein